MKKFGKRKPRFLKRTKRRGTRSLRPYTTRLTLNTRYQYPPLPQQFRVRLRCSQTETVTLPGNTTTVLWYQNIMTPTLSGIDPNNTNTAYAGGFLELMRIYQRCQVRRVHANISCMSLNEDQVVAGGRRECETEMITCILNATVFATLQVAAVDNPLFHQFKNLPSSHCKTLSSESSGVPQVHDSRDLDIETWMGQPLVYDFASYWAGYTNPQGVRTINISMPPTQNAGTTSTSVNMPTIIIGLNAVSASPGGVDSFQYRFTYDYYYDCEFSEMALLSTNPTSANNPIVTASRN